MKSHPTADEVYQRVRKHLPRISLGTVYRNLELLSDKGFLLKLCVGGTQKRFDGTTEFHFHARCTECGKIDDIPGIEMQELIKDISSYTNIEIEEYHVEFLGLCPKCRKN